MALFPVSPVTEATIREDLKKVGGDRAKLMQAYSDRQQEVLQENDVAVGGDLVADANHEYYQLRDKMMALNNLPYTADEEKKMRESTEPAGRQEPGDVEAQRLTVRERLFGKKK